MLLEIGRGSLRILVAVQVSAAAGCASTVGQVRIDDPELALSGAESELAPSGLTASAALDRITKRAPKLDGVARRAGTGLGVTVYVFDGGVFSDHPELAGRVRRGFDAFPETRHTCNAHGTAVAGAIAGKTLGVAPGARIVDVKTIDCARQRGTIAAIVEATDWVIRDHQQYASHPAVVNWSFIVDAASDIPEINIAVSRLHAAGMLVVVSAGNLDINACDVSPANAPGTLVVGASSTVSDSATSSWRDIRATGTAWGPCVDVYAR